MKISRAGTEPQSQSVAPLRGTVRAFHSASPPSASPPSASPSPCPLGPSTSPPDGSPFRQTVGQLLRFRNVLGGRINSQVLKDRRGQVSRRDTLVDDMTSMSIGGAVDSSGRHSASGHHCGKGVGPVVAARLPSVGTLGELPQSRSSSELSHRHHQRRLE